MTSRERLLAALTGEQPDRVPYCEFAVDRALANRLMGWSEDTSQAANLEQNQYTPEEAKALSRELRMDDIPFVLRAPVYAERHAGKDGRLFYGEGQIRTEADLGKLELPDPEDDSLYAEAARFVAQSEDFATCFVTRVGIFPTTLSMGLDVFSIALFENRQFVEEVLARYCRWSLVVAQRACELGFDVFVSTDDMAFKSAPYFSPQVFRDLVLPHYQRLAEVVKIPWVIHSDGNLMPFLDDLVDLGIAGLHPIEKGAMEIREVKRRYGDRLCLLGNVDLNILGRGEPADVDAEVRALIRDVAPGGRYIVSSGNSLAGYLKADNVRALSAAVQRYGAYPIRLT